MATHVGGTGNAADYHLQYEQDRFLESLQATRERQAKRLVVALQALRSDVDGVLDVGAGRGWFLRACQAAGLRQLAGVDSSELAVRRLAEAGIVGFLTGSSPWDDWARIFPQLGFRPAVVTLLDVVEHFPGEQAEKLLGSIATTAAGLEYLVVKVPMSEGALYRAATGFAALGATGPLNQLYQVGTWPPHFHYFSKRSMRALLRRLNFEVVAEYGDPEFEPDRLVSRVGALSRLPGPLQWGATLGAHAVSRLSSLNDTRVFIARRGVVQ